MYDFSGKVALVTGAAGNLGKSVAQGFRAAGATVVAVDRDEARLRTVYPEWDGDDQVLLLGADLTDEDSVQAMVDRALQRYPRIDILANIAGGFHMGPRVHESPLTDWDRMLAMNARSVFLVSRAAIPNMLNYKSGRIINVSARAARQGKAKMGPYCVSKAAVITLTESMAAELKDENITVNCILPGTIDTPENRQAMPNADHSTWVPTGDLAHAIFFLASSAASSVTGAALPVYGRS